VTHVTSGRVKKLIIGCGYLGERVAAEWLRDGQTVAALTRSESRAVELRARGVEPVIGDVTDAASLEALPAAETVLYAVGFDRIAGHSRRAVSVDGLRNVLDALGTSAARWIHISSTSVYGQSAGELVDERSPTEPSQENGQVCLEAEQLVRSRVPGAIILRLAGIYGPGRLLRRVSELKAGAAIAGNPEAWLNLIHVDDAVAAVIAAEERGRDGATYLVCDECPIRRREYYELLARLAAAPAPAFAAEVDALNDAQPDLNKRCSSRRIREEFGLNLRYATIAAGLPQALSASSAR
jgi:nucleoside-diphosphate-sugar epimerase